MNYVSYLSAAFGTVIVGLLVAYWMVKKQVSVSKQRALQLEEE